MLDPVVVELTRQPRDIGERPPDVEIGTSHRSTPPRLVVIEQVVDGATDVIGRRAEPLLVHLGERPP